MNKILIVDDQRDNLDLLTLRLKREGYSVDAFESGLDALVAVLTSYKTRSLYDALILDCSLPVLDGFTITSVIRTIEKTETAPRVWIALYTALPTVVEGTSLVETSDADAYFIKGQDEDRLFTQIASWLSSVAKEK